VPDEYVDEGGLFGTPERIRARWRSEWEGLPFTGITVRTRDEAGYALMADLVGSRDG